VDLVLVLSYLAIGVALALFFKWLSGRPWSFRPVDVASGLLAVAAVYLLQAVGASFELAIAILVVASGLWYLWRRLRAQSA
jgi:hypothetical protein